MTINSAIRNGEAFSPYHNNHNYKRATINSHPLSDKVYLRYNSKRLSSRISFTFQRFLSAHVNLNLSAVTFGALTLMLCLMHFLLELLYDITITIHRSNTSSLTLALTIRLECVSVCVRVHVHVCLIECLNKARY